MAREQGTVHRVAGTTCWVRTTRTEACESCSAREGCHALGGGKEVEIQVQNTLSASVGDLVELSISDSAFLKAVFVVYMVPVFFLMAGALLGNALAPGWGMDPSVGAAVVSAASVSVSAGATVASSGADVSTRQPTITRARMVRMTR